VATRGLNDMFLFCSFCAMESIGVFADVAATADEGRERRGKCVVSRTGDMVH
jgi:hypothetical protein